VARWPYNLPAYQQARRAVLRRDPVCTIDGCTEPSTQADHVIPIADLKAMYPPGDIRAHLLACDPRHMRGACRFHNAQRGGRMGRARRRPTRR
jgi:hypothetical protein